MVLPSAACATKAMVRPQSPPEFVPQGKFTPASPE
jgi:hypothetical protein